MPTTATITPTLGSAPVSLQAGNYSAIDDRRFWSATLAEGILSSGSYQVIQRAAGANMTVDVTSSVGNGALVQGDSVTAQGIYMVPPTAANVNVDIATSDATNPRNDLVVLEIKDDQHDASGLNLARVRTITGTPNASAALTDSPGSNGTPALPSSCLLLAVVRVAAGATTVATAAISDRRTLVGGGQLSTNQLAYVVDEKASGNDGGTFTSGAWRTRTLNTSKVNTITGASLASNQLTLPAGTYWAEASAPAYNVGQHHTRLYNITGSAELVLGTPQTAALVSNSSELRGQFTLSVSSAIELQHYSATTQSSNGFGVGNTFGSALTFARLAVWRTA